MISDQLRCLQLLTVLSFNIILQKCAKTHWTLEVVRYKSEEKAKQ